jgi:hypothetical protein
MILYQIAGWAFPTTSGGKAFKKGRVGYFDWAGNVNRYPLTKPAPAVDNVSDSG